MSVDSIIQIIGIVLSSIIGLISLFIGIKNQKDIKLVMNSSQNYQKEKTIKQSAKVNKNSKSIQVGGDFKNGKTEIEDN